jgi:hypothetical protein
MAETLKVLGQDDPTATVLTDLYTVPGATSAVVSSIMVCNQNATAIKFRVSVAIAGAADDPKQYLYYDVAIPALNTFAATLGVSLATTDVVRVESDTANVSFNLFGTEVT